MKRRNLTRHEDWLCKIVFKNSIPRDRIEIMRWDVGFFGGITPRFRINVDSVSYSDDFIGSDPRSRPSDPDDAHFFLHELCHCWQYFQGVRTVRTAIQAQRHGKHHRKSHGEGKEHKFHSVYDYNAGDGGDLTDYTMEQQADIIADWYALKFWSYRNSQSHHPGLPKPSLTQLEGILANFIENPSYIRTEGRGSERRARRRAIDLS